MARYNVFKNSSLQVVLEESYQDNGWSISQGVAIHDSLNSGYLENVIFKTEADTEYTISINVIRASNGILRLYVGNSLIKEFTAPGRYKVSAMALDNSGIKFWSDGDFSITDVKIMKGEAEYSTLLFSSENNMFNGEISHTSDMMTKFLDDFYSFKDGVPWKHNVNEIRNNFYGEQFPSVITFHVNSSAEIDKDFYSMIINSNQPWYVESVYIYPTIGKSKGQLSRIKPGNFKNHKGRYIADFLRDMNDPRFTNKLEALIKGASLQGKIMRITISNNSTEEVVLTSVETEYSLK